jgi:hypothetical protein
LGILKIFLATALATRESNRAIPSGIAASRKGGASEASKKIQTYQNHFLIVPAGQKGYSTLEFDKLL